MDTKQLKEHLRIEDVQRLLEHLEAEPELKQDIILSTTICHGGNKHKLYYYNNKKIFVCFTGNCGNMDIFALVQKVKNISFLESLKFVQSFFGISNSTYLINNNRVVNPYKQFLKKIKHEDNSPIETINDDPLNYFYNFAPKEWVKEGISPLTMAKFGIKYDIVNQRIIIPHRNSTGDLVGIRCRNLLPELIEGGVKYAPLLYRNKQYNHPTGKVLYGLSHNKDAIIKNRKVILFEAEKSVLKLDSFLGNDNISVGLNGSNLTNYQINLLKQLEIDEIIIGLDKEFKKPFTREERIYAEKIESEFKRLIPYFRVSVLWDKHNILSYKDSPIDKGHITFKKLMNDRITVS